MSRVALRYSQPLGQLCNTLAHRRLLLLRRCYHAQSARRGPACVIAVTPLQATLLDHAAD